MRDPVMTPYGDSFERACIEQWLRTSQTCPISRRPLKMDEIAPNRAVK